MKIRLVATVSIERTIDDVNENVKSQMIEQLQDSVVGQVYDHHQWLLIENDNYTRAKEKGLAGWNCPKCGYVNGINEYPAISRFDNETEICSLCGTKETLQGMKK
jgi:hypothetical protein